MLSSLSAAVSGLDNFQQDMDVIGNNIANINTDGFKDATVNFADSFSNTLAAASANPVQVGTGVYDQAITNNWSSGALSSTGVATDLAINGQGFFVVQNPTSLSQYVTQDGAFSLDPNGYLVTAGGERVLGLTSSGTSAIQVVAPSGSTLQSYTIDTQGNVNMTVTDNTTGAASVVSAGQVAVQNFTDPQALISQSGNLYSNQSAAGASAVGAPGSNGTGSIVSGSLELSNVDLSSEMANLITAQQGFEANSKVVTTSEQMLQTLVTMVQA